MIASISDSTTTALHRALDGLTQRQEVIASNIANVETAGYIAKQVSFEDSLREAIDAGRPAGAQITVSDSSAPTRLNGNNVSIDGELLANSENQLRQSLAIEALNAKYQLMRTAISGR